MGTISKEGRSSSVLLTLCHPGNLDKFNLQSDKELPLVMVFEADAGKSIHILHRRERTKLAGF